ncbi:MAG TPA: aminomethyl-transferring glycine dehydrogenase subunit GcvPB [Candidatus Dormibacteraeota bacterium]|nr:aminomethyl-transferring glycine dehydrogenase subunit GcvPB [Candidatus Dormibacteraeota bacterium]
MTQPLSFEISRPNAHAPRLPDADVTATDPADVLPRELLRARPPTLPRLSEPEVMRHYSKLASMNYSISEQFYPLGSCTMKYNPVANEAAASLPGFSALHPYQDEDSVQGALELMWRLEQALCAIVGVDRVTLQPAAGAHGEWTALRMIQAYHRSRGEARTEVLVPDSAHGTNPASAALSGFQVVEVDSGPDGRISLADLEAKLSNRVAALMLTNPNTLGLFEREILDIAELVHDTGAKLYYDGANLNAFMGVCRPGDMGFDAVHMNLHKTFTTPHGGGGPGAGPVGVKADLVPFLPTPTVERLNGHLKLDFKRPQSIGRVRSFYGNFGMLVRAYTYIVAMGGDGLTQASMDAVLSANYLRRRVEGLLDLPHEGPCMHEFVASARNLAPNGIKALDVAKGLLERDFYAPTIYFPLVVPEAIMVEPTETESKATLDAFAAAIAEIVEEARENPEKLHHEPHSLPVGRLDEVATARQINSYLQGQSEDPILRWKPTRNQPC